MGYFSVGASEVVRRVVYPPFVWAWRLLANLTGRKRRAQNSVDATARADDKRRHMNRWKQSHDR
jgi:hypothetical protein